MINFYKVPCIDGENIEVPCGHDQITFITKKDLKVKL